jgi:hypothetical protein
MLRRERVSSGILSCYDSGMKFSLKTFLLGMCGVGAFVGIMGRLLLEQPEMFQAVLIFVSTVVPFVLAVGTIIYVGRREQRGKLVVWGCCLLLLPVLVLLFQRLFMPTGNPVQLLTTRRLIERRLPQQIEEPWVWQELERRTASGRLTMADVSDAFETLILHMKTNRPAGWNQPLSWQHEFIGKAIGAKLISDEMVLKLCDAFFGLQPKVQPIAPVAAGQPGFQVQVDYGNPWVFNSGIGTELLWDVKSVELDGKPMKISQPNRFAQQWNAFCDGPLSTRDHELKVEVECAYVDESSARAMNTATKIPPSQWPTAKKRWTATVTAPVKVEETKQNRR